MARGRPRDGPRAAPADARPQRKPARGGEWGRAGTWASPQPAGMVGHVTSLSPRPGLRDPGGTGPRGSESPARPGLVPPSGPGPLAPRRAGLVLTALIPGPHTFVDAESRPTGTGSAFYYWSVKSVPGGPWAARSVRGRRRAADGALIASRGASDAAVPRSGLLGGWLPRTVPACCEVREKIRDWKASVPVRGSW